MLATAQREASSLFLPRNLSRVLRSIPMARDMRRAAAVATPSICTPRGPLRVLHYHTGTHVHHRHNNKNNCSNSDSTAPGTSSCWGCSCPVVLVQRPHQVAKQEQQEQQEQQEPHHPHQQQHQKRTEGPEPVYSFAKGGYWQLQCRRRMRFPFGGELQRLDIAFEVYGHLNEKRDNAILLGCGVSASSHAKSHPHNRETGWWEGFIGPGKALDTNRFFIICIANLGGCSGTSGPSSFIPQQQQKKPPEPAADNEIRYGLNFPWFTVQDMARVQLRVIDRLQIGRLHAAVGSSLGALQVLCLGALFPSRVGRLAVISGALYCRPMAIAFRYIQRQILMADPAFACGNYYGKKYPSVGMRLARQVATITYRSGPEWMLRFGRLRVPGAHQTSSKGEVLGEEKQGVGSPLGLGSLWPLLGDDEKHLKAGIPPPLHAQEPDQQQQLQQQQQDAEQHHHQSMPSLGADFAIEAYVEQQGRKWRAYDPNSLLYLSKAMDLFSLARRDPHTGTSSLVYGVRNLQMPVLVMGVHSDLLFPLEQQIEIKDTLRKAGNKMVSFYSLDSIYGHDTFLIDVTNVGAGVKGHLEQEFDTNHSAQYLGQSKIEYQAKSNSSFMHKPPIFPAAPGGPRGLLARNTQAHSLRDQKVTTEPQRLQKSHLCMGSMKPEQGMALLPMAPTGKKPEQDTFRGPVDFVSANREAVSMLECKKPKQKTPKGQFSRHKNFGVIPRYVKVRSAFEVSYRITGQFCRS
ncbi:serine O-succinyltransferase [Cyclospora cayetanensis]|uniref:Serine O-succinyltransferase n=1 Tax=Cyclospora cayetanensis TaxID=88456 RepID=A0A6P6S3X4_9EIME|nr:serine O-succinyltransferase [Cyclospora cayetanensis]